MTRVVRTVAGVALVLVAVPVLLAGAVLWAALAHRGPDGSFDASIEPVMADGYAVVVPDVDGLLRREVPFVRGGDTALRVSARTKTGPAFIGLAPAAAVAGYLAGVPHTQVTDLKLTRGALPVRAVAVTGENAPATAPTAQPFWVVNSTSTAIPDTVDWVPSALRGQHFALVVMSPDGSAPVQVELRAAATVTWLPSTTWAVSVLGAAVLLAGLLVLCWPVRQVQVVYVVEPGQLPEVADGHSLHEETVAVVVPPLALPSRVDCVPTSHAGSAWPSPPPRGEPPPPPPQRPRPPVTLQLDWPPRSR